MNVLVVVMVSFLPLLASVAAAKGFLSLGPHGECPVLTLLPFTARSETAVPDRPSHISFGHLAAAVLAMEQATVDNDDDDDCNVHFYHPTFVDDGDSPDQATRAILDTLYALKEDSRNESLPLCAILGNLKSQPAEAAATIAAASDAVYATHSADIARIGRFPIHPGSVRLTVDEYTRGKVTVDYLYRHRRRNYVFTLYNFVHQDWVKVMDTATKQYPNMQHRSVAIAPPWTADNRGPNSVWQAMQTIKASGFRTIMVAVSHMFLWNGIKREAVNAGMTGVNGYVWMTADGTTDLEALANWDNSTEIVAGLGSVQTLDGLHWRGEQDLFWQSWKSQDASTVQRVKDLYPLLPSQAGYFDAPNDFFQTYSPPSLSSFLYDTIIALKKGACQAQQQNDDSDASLRRLQNPGNLLKPSGNFIFDAMVAQEFEGASGHVKLNDGFSYTRDPETVAIGAYNFRPKADGNGYDYVLTSIKFPGQDWQDVPEEAFVFADGTTVEPMPLRDVFENNYLNAHVRIIGLLLFGTAAFIASSGLVWVICYRNTVLVKAAQPEFLVCVCLGAMVTSCAILTLSVDESYGWDPKGLDRACMATPWLFVLGYVIVYAALFSKLWRLQKLLDIRRRTAVKPWHTTGPAVTLLFSAVAILTVWNVVDPFVWERETIHELTGESFGQCTSDHWRVFTVLLVAIMMSATLLAGWMAWKTKDVTEDLSETKWIFYAIFAQLQVWVVGIPVIVIVKDDYSTDAAFLGSALVIFTFAVSVVLLIVGPRIFRTHFPEGFESTSRRSQLSVTTSNNCYISGLDHPSRLVASRSSAIVAPDATPISAEMECTRAANPEQTADVQGECSDDQLEYPMGQHVASAERNSP